MPEVAPMLIVENDSIAVERELWGGLLACPPCRGPLGPWGHASVRVLRCLSGDLPLRPRRAKCRQCTKTHVLLPGCCLERRRDEVAVIGAAIEAKAGGCGHRPIAEKLGVSKDTVRGWLRRFAGRWEAIRAHFTRWAYALDPELGRIEPSGSTFCDALEAIAAAARAWALRLGWRPVWALASALSGGALLRTTSCPFPVVR